MSNARRHIDRRVRGLRLALKTETDLAVVAHRFFDVMGDPAINHACTPSRDPALAEMLWRIIERAGYLEPDEGGPEDVMLMSYAREGFYHGMLATRPLVFFYFRKDRQGLVVDSAVGTGSRFTRFSALEVGRDAIPVPGPTTLQ